MKNYIKKSVTLGLVGCALLCPMSSVLAFTKNETVYTNLDTTGKVTSTSVTNHLLLAGEKDFEDTTELKEILNINGKETFTLEGNSLKWNSNGKDIFYRGKTEKEQPIEVEIKYYLDEKEMTAKEMIGKKGNVKIVFNFKNKLENKVNVDGKMETIYTPFVVTAGMVLDNKYNSNIEVINGKWVDSGSRSIVVGLATPGLYESFAVKELESLNQITISYTTTKFSLGTMYMVATPKILEEKDFQIFDKLDELSSNVSLLQENMNQIEAGAKELESGSASLVNGASEVSTNLSKISSSITALSSGAVELKEGLNEVLASLRNLETQLPTGMIASSLQELNQLKAANEASIANIVSQTGMDMATLKAFYEENNLKEYNGEDENLLAIKSAYELAYLLSMNNMVLNKSITALTEVEKTVNELLPLVEGALDTIENGANTVMAKLMELEAGMRKLSEGANAVTEGTKNLHNGIINLSSGITAFNKQGINTLYSYANQIHSYSSKAEAMVSLSNEYQGYVSSNADSTMFVYMIKSVK